MTGCALLTEQGDWLPWTLQAAAQVIAGAIAYVYFSRQAGRFQSRIDELTRLEDDADTDVRIPRARHQRRRPTLIGDPPNTQLDHEPPA